MNRQLCRHGTILILLGLTTGLAVDRMVNTRVALSAHLTAVQGGMMLIVFGLLWPALVLGHRGEVVARLGAIASMYLTWLALILTAAGSASSPSRFAVNGALLAGAVAVLAATVLVLYGLRKTTDPGRVSSAGDGA